MQDLWVSLPFLDVVGDSLQPNAELFSEEVAEERRLAGTALLEAIELPAGMEWITNNTTEPTSSSFSNQYNPLPGKVKGSNRGPGGPAIVRVDERTGPSGQRNRRDRRIQKTRAQR